VVGEVAGKLSVVEKLLGVGGDGSPFERNETGEGVEGAGVVDVVDWPLRTGGGERSLLRIASMIIEGAMKANG
jgi:hypothetical protein